MLSRVVIIYLRNLLTHTVNNILQKLNYAIRYHHSVVKQKFSNIDIMCEIFRTIPWVLCNIHNLKGSTSKVTKIGVLAQVCVSVRQF